MMNQKDKIKIMTISALLCAIGIMIPMFFPKIQIEPASYTLASHVPIFIAMFISPTVAVSVATITGFGFLIAGFPIVIVLRAFTHLVFATLGAFILKKNGNILLSWKSATLYSLFIGIVHGLAEVVAVTYFYMGDETSPFYWGDKMANAFTEKGYILSVLLLVGVGSIIHSMIDFSIAAFVWKPLQHVITIPANAKIGRGLDRR